MPDPTRCRNCGQELTDEPEREAGICRACTIVGDEGSEGGFALEIKTAPLGTYCTRVLVP